MALLFRYFRKTYQDAGARIETMRDKQCTQPCQMRRARSEDVSNPANFGLGFRMLLRDVPLQSHFKRPTVRPHLVVTDLAPAFKDMRTPAVQDAERSREDRRTAGRHDRPIERPCRMTR
ncbi:hypothetical protein D9M70_609330 [compost metagenome]